MYLPISFSNIFIHFYQQWPKGLELFWLTRIEFVQDTGKREKHLSSHLISPGIYIFWSVQVEFY